MQAGVVRLHCASGSPLVFSACLDGGVRAWDLRSGECVREWLGHSDQILDMVIARYVSVHEPMCRIITGFFLAHTHTQG